MKLIAVALAGGLLAISAGAASAATITQIQSYGPSTTVFRDGPLTFQAFDTSLGTLTGVTLVISNVSSTYSGSVTNLGQQPITDMLSIQTRITTAASSNTPAALVGLALTTPGESYTYSLNPNATFTYGPTTESPANQSFAIASSNFAQFENGSFSLFAAGTSPYSFNTGGSETSSNVVTAQGDIEIDYAYTASVSPVPEPASMALLGTGLLGLGLTRRRA